MFRTNLGEWIKPKWFDWIISPFKYKFFINYTNSPPTIQYSKPYCMWSVDEGPYEGPTMKTMFVRMMNELSDLHIERALASHQNRPPWLIWIIGPSKKYLFHMDASIGYQKLAKYYEPDEEDWYIENLVHQAGDFLKCVNTKMETAEYNGPPCKKPYDPMVIHSSKSVM